MFLRLMGGEYTVENIMNDARSEQIGAWWRIADHTEGNETGRMMVVNGYNPGAVFFRAAVDVEENTSYLFTAWILNLFRVTGYPNPEWACGFWTETVISYTAQRWAC